MTCREVCGPARGQQRSLPMSSCSLASVSLRSCPASLLGLGWPLLRGVGKGCCQPLKQMDLKPARLCPRQALHESWPESPSRSPTPMGWDRPQPAGLPALINTGQAAKAAAGSILPGGPSSAGVNGGGAAAWLRGSGGWGRAAQSRKGRHHLQSPLSLHPLTLMHTVVQSTDI